MGLTKTISDFGDCKVRGLSICVLKKNNAAFNKEIHLNNTLFPYVPLVELTVNRKKLVGALIFKNFFKRKNISFSSSQSLASVISN